MLENLFSAMSFSIKNLLMCIKSIVHALNAGNDVMKQNRLHRFKMRARRNMPGTVSGDLVWKRMEKKYGYKPATEFSHKGVKITRVEVDEQSEGYKWWVSKGRKEYEEKHGPAIECVSECGDNPQQVPTP